MGLFGTVKDLIKNKPKIIKKNGLLTNEALLNIIKNKDLAKLQDEIDKCDRLISKNNKDYKSIRYNTLAAKELKEDTIKICLEYGKNLEEHKNILIKYKDEMEGNKNTISNIEIEEGRNAIIEKDKENVDKNQINIKNFINKLRNGSKLLTNEALIDIIKNKDLAKLQDEIDKCDRLIVKNNKDYRNIRYNNLANKELKEDTMKICLEYGKNLEEHKDILIKYKDAIEGNKSTEIEKHKNTISNLDIEIEESRNAINGKDKEIKENVDKNEILVKNFINTLRNDSNSGLSLTKIYNEMGYQNGKNSSIGNMISIMLGVLYQEMDGKKNIYIINNKNEHLFNTLRFIMKLKYSTNKIVEGKNNAEDKNVVIKSINSINSYYGVLIVNEELLNNPCNHINEIEQGCKEFLGKLFNVSGHTVWNFISELVKETE